MILTSEIFAVL